MLKIKYFYIVLMLSLLLITFFSYKNIKCNSNLSHRNDIIKSLNKNTDIKLKYEGQPVSRFMNLKLNEYKKFKNLNNLINEYLLIIIDTIDCFSCFEFHLKKINSIDIKKVIYSPKYNHMILSKLSNKNINKTIKDYSVSISEGIFVALISSEGKIIYADAADKTNYDKSKVFYEIVGNYIYY